MNESLKALLQNQYLMLNNLLATPGQNIIMTRPENNKWSVFENVAHLGRYNEVFFNRLHKILNENNPLFERYVADEDAGFIEWCGRSFDLVFADYHSSRKAIIKFFESLSDNDLKRTGTHLKFGELSVPEWLNFYLLHEAHHLFTIFKLLHSKE